jgi:hypothetical protein
MSETPINMGFTDAREVSPPTGSAPAAAAPAAGAPAQSQQQQHPAENPRSRGHSPAISAREQAPAPGERKVTIGGMERPEQEVLDILGAHAERQVVQAALPKDPNGYQIKLPDGFKAPEGMQFEFKTDDPALRQFQEIAHRRGLSQEAFSEALGAFAGVKLAEHQTMIQGRQTEINKLGAAAGQRIDAVEAWLRARVGDKANTLITQLKHYPVAGTVEAMEGLMRAFSSQGGHGVTQSGREGEADAGKIAGYENMSFAQKRAAQMNQKFGGNR